MTWKTWIAIEPENTTNETVKQLYNNTRDPTSGRPPDIVCLTSLTPKVGGLILALNRAIHGSAEGLTAREQEVAALIVSSYNGWAHWIASHLAALGRAAKNEKLAEQVKDDFTKADLSPRERRIADFTAKVTRSPNACSPADVRALKDGGLSDKDILSLVEIIAYYNMSNRLFEALSTLDPWWLRLEAIQSLMVDTW
jgi:uncharacterized peroxidase-related enzyme